MKITPTVFIFSRASSISMLRFEKWIVWTWLANIKGRCKTENINIILLATVNTARLCKYFLSSSPLLHFYLLFSSSITSFSSSLHLWRRFIKLQEKQKTFSARVDVPSPPRANSTCIRAHSSPFLLAPCGLSKDPLTLCLNKPLGAFPVSQISFYCCWH